MFPTPVLFVVVVVVVAVVVVVVDVVVVIVGWAQQTSFHVFWQMLSLSLAKVKIHCDCNQ